MKIDSSLGLLGVLLEPTTVVTKAWEQVVTVGQRAFWEPQTALVTGAGPIGLLAALVARQHGLDVHVLDRVESGPKPRLVRALGATYHTGTVASVGFQPDVIVECTGAGEVIADSIQAIAPGGVVWLTGVFRHDACCISSGVRQAMWWTVPAPRRPDVRSGVQITSTRAAG